MLTYNSISLKVINNKKRLNKKGGGEERVGEGEGEGRNKEKEKKKEGKKDRMRENKI